MIVKQGDIVKKHLQEAMDLAEEIDWNDNRINSFVEDLDIEFDAFYKTLLAINGYQAWEGH